MLERMSREGPWLYFSSFTNNRLYFLNLYLPNTHILLSYHRLFSSSISCPRIYTEANQQPSIRAQKVLYCVRKKINHMVFGSFTLIKVEVNKQNPFVFEICISNYTEVKTRHSSQASLKVWSTHQQLQCH